MKFYKHKQKKPTRHGLSDKPMYKKLMEMKRRCYAKDSKDYAHYGGRGITICKRWLEDPETFMTWCSANGYKRGLHLDRIDNDKGYSPENCKFVSPTENNRNQRTSKWWYVDGVQYESLRHAAKQLDVNPKTIAHWCDGSRGNCWSELKYPEET